MLMNEMHAQDTPGGGGGTHMDMDSLGTEIDNYQNLGGFNGEDMGNVADTYGTYGKGMPEINNSFDTVKHWIKS
jgi:hypothetical protein